VIDIRKKAPAFYSGLSTQDSLLEDSSLNEITGRW
jgi:hypothetical protein